MLDNILNTLLVWPKTTHTPSQTPNLVARALIPSQARSRTHLIPETPCQRQPGWSVSAEGEFWPPAAAVKAYHT